MALFEKKHYSIELEKNLSGISNTYPKNMTKEALRDCSDEQIVAWWRNLPTGKTPYEEYISRRICYEFNGRFRGYLVEEEEKLIRGNLGKVDLTKWLRNENMDSSQREALQKKIEGDLRSMKLDEKNSRKERLYLRKRLRRTE